MFLRSAAVGMVAAIAIGVLASALSPFFDAVGVYIVPAGVLLPVIGRVIPSKIQYWLTPDGGPAAGFSLFWSVRFCSGRLFLECPILLGLK